MHGRGGVLTAIVGIALLASACAAIEQNVRDAIELYHKLRGREPAPPPPAPPPAAQMPESASSGLSLDARCVGKEETGYAETVRLEVTAGVVQQFEARIDIPKRGNCRFAFSDFRQTQRTPYVELVSRTNGNCAVRMWQQGDRVTVAATECEQKCSNGAFEYLWPIELKSPEGGCY